MRPRVFVLGAAFACLLALGGCNPSAPTSNAPDGAVDYQSSHGIAAHRPDSLATAVTQLSARRDALLAASPPTDIATALRELKEIVRWLPELAGDSDLRRADWEQVRQLADELAAITEPWDSAQDAAATTSRTEFDRILAALRPLAEKSAVVPYGT